MNIKLNLQPEPNQLKFTVNKHRGSSRFFTPTGAKVKSIACYAELLFMCPIQIVETNTQPDPSSFYFLRFLNAARSILSFLS